MAGLSRLLGSYHRVEPGVQARPDGSNAGAVRSYLRRTMQELLGGETGRAPGEVWRDLLSSCVVEWRGAHDESIGVACVDAGCGETVVVKRGGLSVLRATHGAERDLLRAMLETEGATDDDDGYPESALDAPHAGGACVLLSHRMLVWAEAADLGGAHLFSALLSGEAEHLVEDAVRALLLCPEDQPPECDPENILGRFPELLLHLSATPADEGEGEDAGDAPGLCASVEAQLVRLERFLVRRAASDGAGAWASDWMEVVVEQACEQVRDLI